MWDFAKEHPGLFVIGLLIVGDVVVKIVTVLAGGAP